jgi:hypothetical protein
VFRNLRQQSLQVLDSQGRRDNDEAQGIETAIPAGNASLRCHDPLRRILEVGAGEATTVRVGDHLIAQ